LFLHLRQSVKIFFCCSSKNLLILGQTLVAVLFHTLI
jgi:hypothetical protein